MRGGEGRNRRDEPAPIARVRPLDGELHARQAEFLAQRRALANDYSTQAAFAVAAMRSPVTGYVFLRGDGIVARNSRFLRMDREHRGDWRTPRGVLPSLSECVKQQSAALAKVLEVVRVERTDGSCIVDVRTERIGAASTRLVAATVLDVTESVQASRALEAAQQTRAEELRVRALGEVASGFAHDFNNLLHGLKMWVSVLRGGPEGRPSERQRHALDSIDRILRDAAARVGQIQDAARSRGDAPVQSLDVAEIVRDAVELARAQVVERSHLLDSPVQIETSIPAGLPRVRGADSELRSVFLNLLLNARDAMPQGGKIRLTAAREGDAVVVAVADEGTGIAREILARIFDPFFTTKRGTGTGLGLSIARNVMRRLGGTITAANRARSRGAVFTLTFPIAEAALSAEAPAAPARSEGTAAAQRVLVVDDDPDGLEALAAVLRHDGHEAATAASGPEAVARFERGERYDVVFTDLGMPDMNGWEVADRLCAIAPDVRVFIVTGWGHEITSEERGRRGVAGVLAKPLNLDELYRSLQSSPASRSGAGGSPTVR